MSHSNTFTNSGAAFAIVVCLVGCATAPNVSRGTPGPAAVADLLHHLADSQAFPLPLKDVRAVVRPYGGVMRNDTPDFGGGGYHWESDDGRCVMLFPIDEIRGTVSHFWAKCSFDDEASALQGIQRWRLAVGSHDSADSRSLAVGQHSTSFVRIVDSVAVDASLDLDNGKFIAGVGLRNGVSP